MSVRTVRDWSEPLTNAYWSAVNAPTNPEAADRTLALLDAYAHELAEKIRESTRGQYSQVIGGWGADRARDWAVGRERAAELIDPEVSSDG